MNIAIVCPNCGARDDARAATQGQRLRCRQCAAIFSAGLAAAPALPEKAQAALTSAAPRRPRKRSALGPLAWLLILGGMSASFLVMCGLFFVFWLLWTHAPGFQVPQPRLAGVPGPMPNFNGPAFLNGGDNPNEDEEVKEVPRQEPAPRLPPLGPPPGRETPAVERKQALLVQRHQVGARPLTLQSWLDLRVQDPPADPKALTVQLSTFFIEATQAVDSEERAALRLQWRAQLGEVKVDGTVAPEASPPPWRREIAQLAANAHVDRHGNWLWHELDTARLTQRGGLDIAETADRIKLLELLAIPLPNRPVEPGESWKADRPVALHVARSVTAPGTAELTMTYLGTRRLDNRTLAVITLAGTLHGRKGSEKRLSGNLDGLAYFDVELGTIAQVDARLQFELAPQPGTQSATVRSSGTLTLRLQGPNL